MTTAKDALKRLVEGNQRFVSMSHAPRHYEGRERRMELVMKHEPFAVILGCSDARVPAEIVFDQGPGDLFVIRVAGNIVAPSQIGSVEFAATQFGVPLVLVLGHTQCGAVQATLDEISRPSESQSPNLATIVDRIRPAFKGLPEDDGGGSLQELAVRANVMASVRQLQRGSEILEELIGQEKLLVVGAVYAIETGSVEFCPGQDLP